MFLFDEFRWLKHYIILLAVKRIDTHEVYGISDPDYSTSGAGRIQIRMFVWHKQIHRYTPSVYVSGWWSSFVVECFMCVLNKKLMGWGGTSAAVVISWKEYYVSVFMHTCTRLTQQSWAKEWGDHEKCTQANEVIIDKWYWVSLAHVGE